VKSFQDKYWEHVTQGENMNTVLHLIRANAKAIVAGVVTIVAGVVFNVPVEVQAGPVALIVWLVPNRG
jgi:hypothetical protein